MVIKAANSITIISIKDVASTIRYYLLQDSTLTAPAAPTTNTPGGSWVTTEPTYTEGSTNSLYTCDKTVFSDGAWAYSTVSLSSSYEAAKVAYNKAAAVQTTTTVSVNQLSDRIQTEVSNRQVTDNNVNNVSSRTTMLEQKADGLAIDVSSTMATSENVNQHFTFDTAGLTIANALDPNAMKMVLSNTALNFVANGLSVLELDGSTSTAKASKFQVGHYCWTSTGDGANMSLLYVGDA